MRRYIAGEPSLPEPASEPEKDTESRQGWLGKVRDIIIAGLVGFLLSQLTVIGEVKKTSIDLEHFQRQTANGFDDIRKTADADRRTSDERIHNISLLIGDLVKQQTAQIEQGKELIMLIKVQNQINASKP